MSRPSAPLDGRVALVTGAATGIGRAIATALAADGARIVVNHLNTPEAAAGVVAGIQRAGGTAYAHAADVGVRDEYRSMVDRLIDEYGHWDILVNNAAVAVTKPFADVTEQEFDHSFSVNVKGVFHGLQLALERLGDSGRVITISSSTTALALAGYAVYDATKGAVEQFTRILAKDFGKRGITLNTLSPGATETETYRNGKTEEFLVGVSGLSAFGRLGRPAEIAAVAAFLASEDAGWVTAQNIRVNGGTA